MRPEHGLGEMSLRVHPVEKISLFLKPHLLGRLRFRLACTAALCSRAAEASLRSRLVYNHLTVPGSFFYLFSLHLNHTYMQQL